MSYGVRKTEPLFICKNCGEYICGGDIFLDLEDGKLCLDCMYSMNREELLKMAGIEFLEAGEQEG